MTNLRESLTQVRERIERACRAAGRPSGSVGLLAVSKTVGVDRVRAAADLGQRAFGENYLQEGLAKQDGLADLGLEWHFIGPVQSNKTRDLALHFDWVHGVDRLRIAQRLSEARNPARDPLQVCVQVNISGETRKSGCAPDDAPALCEAIAALPGLRLRGLMAIPAPAGCADDARAPYRRLRELFDRIRAAGTPLDTISAGMTDDLEAAIAEGSTLVRVGTALFGKRNST
ncbi:MAG: YggS family pyridoxal phosphate-dependent enzyme [Panacagrimonas sp.]|jgi:pyridoxal phosphate enzyme (YggS family)|nr:YggS family pyridoxal phosphate-dependent enzyme [Panacagrimonas sp.]MCC2656119.1 YggS family pyridoxal phosphate-dependent enzyme [Panacagrimonas sp.]